MCTQLISIQNWCPIKNVYIKKSDAGYSVVVKDYKEVSVHCLGYVLKWCDYREDNKRGMNF